MRWAVRVAGLAALIAAVAFLVVTYREHQVQLAAQAARDAPVIAPSRVKDVQGKAMVVLDSADLARLGLRTAVLRPAAAGALRRLTGELVPEPDRVTAVRAPIAGRLSVPDGARWPAFGDRVAAHGEIAQVSDAKPLVLARGGTVTQVGAQPGEMVQAGQLLLEVTDYDRALARIPWPPDAPPPPRQIALSLAAPGAHTVSGHLVGAAPSADPVTRLPAYLYRAERGWSGARPGSAVVASIASGNAQTRGVVVPQRAVVQWEGLTWAFLQRGTGHFHRVRVPTDRPLPGGFLAAGELAAGDTVVIQGAEQLLSEEFRARVTVGDEPGE